MQTINKKNIDVFEKDAALWWSEQGPFHILHKINPIRVRYISNHIISYFQRQNIDGVKILDVGCGGGILCESFFRLGANVTGIDASEGAIDVAKSRQIAQENNIDYHLSTIEDFEQIDFDVVCALEIIEHVDDLEFFIQKLAKKVKVNGLVFISTLNRTWQSYLSAIIGAEYILRFIPKGTHDWKKFIKPIELVKLAENSGLKFLDIKGFSYNFINERVRLVNNASVNYMACFTKN